MRTMHVRRDTYRELYRGYAVGFDRERGRVRVDIDILRRDLTKATDRVNNGLGSVVTGRQEAGREERAR